MSEQKPEHEDDDRVSLDPLSPEEALKALLKVDPESEPAEEEQQEDKP